MVRQTVGLFLLSLSTVVFAGGLEGDSRALERVDRMFAALGGRDLWAEARSLHTIERSRHPSYGDGIETAMWHDLEQPGEYAHMIHPEVEIKRGWNEDSGWTQRDGELRDYSDKELEKRKFDWYSDVYTLYHQLAKSERSLTVRTAAPDGFDVLDEKAKKIATFRLSPEGQVYYWEQVGGEKPIAYIYGPHRDFGEVSFPDWGTTKDGGWSFYYLQVRPSKKSFAANVNLVKPDLGWSGGSLHKEKCRE